MPSAGHVHDVRILRMNHDAANVMCRSESHLFHVFQHRATCTRRRPLMNLPFVLVRPSRPPTSPTDPMAAIAMPPIVDTLLCRTLAPRSCRCRCLPYAARRHSHRTRCRLTPPRRNRQCPATSRALSREIPDLELVGWIRLVGWPGERIYRKPHPKCHHRDSDLKTDERDS